MRSAIWATCVFVLFVCGCFNPHVKNGGFACSTTDPDPCPQGFFCVAGICQDHPGGGGGGAGGGVGGVGTPDLAASVGDMAGPAHDLSNGQGATDMTTLPDLEPPADMTMCKQSGSLCSSSSSCCSGTCFVFCI